MSILYLYITIFSLYFMILALASLKPARKVRDKYTSKDSNICVVVYATGESDTLENLVKQLKSQTYHKNNYIIYVILDKVENPPEYIFQTDLDIKLININNIEPIGKSQAYSILAEKLSEVPNLDAYVFIDANNYVDSDFIENINYYLTKYDVFIPMINYIGEYKEMKFWDCVKVTYSRYLYKFIYKTRTRLGLTNLINTDIFIIKKDLLNQIALFDFKDKISEANYTLKLAKEGYKVAFVDDVEVYRDVKNYDSRVPSLSRRLSLFWHNWTNCNNVTSLEYVCSFLSPNWMFCIFVYLFLLSHTYMFVPVTLFWVFDIGYSFILITSILLVLAFCVSLINAQIYAKEYLFLFAYPLYSIGHLLYNFPPIRFVRNLIFNKNHKHNIDKMVTDVIVTDGKNDYPCKIELISDDGLARVKFINHNKTYTTKNNHLRMVDALKELTAKLHEYGLSLKVCQSCKYFQPVVDGSTNMVQGCCKCNFEGRVSGDIIPTLIWNTCPKFEKENVVNLF